MIAVHEVEPPKRLTPDELADNLEWCDEFAGDRAVAAIRGHIDAIEAELATMRDAINLIGPH